MAVKPKKKAQGIDDLARLVASKLGKAGNTVKKVNTPKKPTAPRSSGGAGRAGRGRPKAAATQQAQARKKANTTKAGKPKAAAKRPVKRK